MAISVSDFSPTITPTGNALVANFSLTLPDGASAYVEFWTAADLVLTTSSAGAPAGGGTVSILVAGMLPSTTYSMQAVVHLASGPPITTTPQQFTTQALPTNIKLPTLTVTVPPGETPSPGVELINIIQPSGISVVSDLQGNVIWYYDNAQDANWHGYAFPIKFLPNGHLIASVSNMYTPPFQKKNVVQSVLREIDLAGNTIQTATGPRELYLQNLNMQLKKVPTSKGSTVLAYCYSHDVLPLANGHTILLVQQLQFVEKGTPPTPTAVMGDALIDLDENYQAVWAWSAFDWLDVSRWPPPFRPPNPPYDWTHCNAVIQTPDGNLLLSSRDQSWILKLNYQNGLGDGSILWTLGYDGSFAWNGSGDADWFAAQHFPCIMATNGNQITSLAMFDNGDDRVTTNDMYSRGAIFTIDETNMQASLQWQWVPNQYSNWGGSIQPLSTGNIEICMSEPCAVNTVPPKTDLPSVIVEVTSGANPTLVWQMSASPGAVYRSLRVPSLYPGVIW